MAESATPSPGVDDSSFLLLVVGAHLRAEVADRPIAYRLQNTIAQWVGRYGEQLSAPIIPIVCCDVYFMNQEPLQKRPTISIGGPGVNALSAFYAQRLNPALVRGNQMLIQLDPEFVDLRVCIWGMDHALTITAVDHFVERYLEPYLRAVATQVEPKVD
ncbi:MAG: hypothetical protein WD042_12820 [Phycisphaeraceae bacterium]